MVQSFEQCNIGLCAAAHFEVANGVSLSVEVHVAILKTVAAAGIEVDVGTQLDVHAIGIILGVLSGSIPIGLSADDVRGFRGTTIAANAVAVVSSMRASVMAALENNLLIVLFIVIVFVV